MRLTNVSQMQVQPGRLYSYSMRTQPPDRHPPVRLPVSFDQDRHVSFGSRPGSWMAVAFSLPVPASREAIAEAWSQVISRHGTLRSIFTWKDQDDGGPEPDPPSRQHSGGPQTRLCLTEVTITPGQWEELSAAGAQSPDVLRSRLRSHFDQACRSFATPSYRLCVIEEETGERTPQVIIGSDHAHIDAWSLLVLARDLAECVQDVLAGEPVGARLPPAEAFAAHSQQLEDQPFPPQEVLSRWSDILAAGGGSMPRFPLDLGDISQPVEEIVEIRDVFDSEELAQVEAHAAEHQVRLIAVAVSVMTRLAGELSGEPFRAVFPVHSRHDRRWFDSVGWFITNSVLENHQHDYQGSYAAVKEAARLGSYPLAPIMRPYGGMPQDPGMFAMSWLDHRKLPVKLAEDLNPQHVSAVIRTDGVMIWFVINQTGMHLRCRYPDTRQARRSMRTWLAGLVYGLRAPLELQALRALRADPRSEFPSSKKR